MKRNACNAYHLLYQTPGNQGVPKNNASDLERVNTKFNLVRQHGHVLLAVDVVEPVERVHKVTGWHEQEGEPARSVQPANDREYENISGGKESVRRLGECNLERVITHWKSRQTILPFDGYLCESIERHQVAQKTGHVPATEVQATGHLIEPERFQWIANEETARNESIRDKLHWIGYHHV